MTDDTAPACPECDSLDVQRLIKPWSDDRDAEPDYRCDRCTAHFDEPVQREPRGHRTRGHLSPAGQALRDMDPDDVGAD